MTALATAPEGSAGLAGIRAVPDDARGATVELAARLAHQCPHRNETDRGDIALTWTVTDVTLEIHDLVTYLDEWADVHITHEALTDRIWHDLKNAGVAPVSVTTTWITAGANITVRRTA